MDMMVDHSRKVINIKLLEHRSNGLFVAISDDLKGLYVSGRSEHQVLDRLPRVMKMLLEATGETVLSLELVEDPTTAEFLVKGPTYAAELAG